MMPFLGRELLVSLRDRRQFGSLAMLMVVAALVMVFTWASIERQSRAVNTMILSRTIFIGMAWVQLIVGGLTGFRSAAAIARERERETWDLLIATPVRPLRLMLEKTASYVAGLLLMFVSLVPILALCFLLGGLGPDEVIGAYAIVFICTLVSTVIGVACSAWCRTETGASRLCALAHFFYFVLLPFFVFFGLYLVARLVTYFTHTGSVQWEFQERFAEHYGIFLITMSPISALGFLFFSQGTIPLRQFASTQTIPNIPSIWLSPVFVYAVMSFALILLLLIVTFLRLRRSWLDQPHRVANRKRSKSSAISFVSTFSDRGNIVMERELLSVGRSRFGRWWVRLLFTLAGIGLIYVLFYEAIFYSNPRECWTLLQYSIYFAGSFFAITAASSAFTRERAQNTWDLLVTTMLQPKTIVHGKLWAVSRTALSTILMIVIAAVTLAGLGSRNIDQFFQQRPPFLPFVILMLGVWVIQLSCGVFFSVRAETTTRAQSRTTAVALLHASGPLLILTAIFWGSRLYYLDPREQWAETLVAYCAVFSPLMLLMGRESFNISWIGDYWEWCQVAHGVCVLVAAAWLVRRSIGRLSAVMMIRRPNGIVPSDHSRVPLSGSSVESEARIMKEL